MSDILLRWKKLSPRVAKLALEIPEDILAFWDPKRFCFSRSNAELHLSRAYFPTATYRCVQALATVGTTTQRALLAEFASYLSKNPPLALDSGLDQDNVFTRSHLIQSLAHVPDALPNADRTAHVDALAQHLIDHHGACFSGEPPHAFLTYHALVALLGERSAACNDAAFVPVWQGLEDRLYRFIALHESGAAVQADVVELAFCLCALALRKAPEAPVLNKALEIVCTHQGADGAWPIGRPLRYSGHGSVNVPSIEVALALADLAERLDADAPTCLLDTLCKVAELLLQSRRVVSGSGPVSAYRGWANDRARREDLVESWVNAVAAMFLYRLTRAASSYTSRVIIERHSGESPADIEVTWKQIKETDVDYPIKNFLYERVIAPTQKDNGRPKKDSCSVILYGPPGTSKTTLAKGMAKELEWPIITLTPGSFVERGLELIETRTREVFDDLFHIERAVILFDECDELFLKRPDKPTDASTRTIASLITATMLPRLQRLHDLHRSIFVLATNLFESLDDAIRRPGRFDYRISVGPPDEKARRIILDGELPAALKPVPESLVMATERFTYTELKRISRDLNARAATGIDERTARKLIDAAKVGLSISETRYKEFITTEQTASDHRIVMR